MLNNLSVLEQKQISGGMWRILFSGIVYDLTKHTVKSVLLADGCTACCTGAYDIDDYAAAVEMCARKYENCKC